MATSLNGWKRIRTAPVTRPGPDNKNPSGFANTDVADVLSAFMWWYHTELEFVTQWGGHRKPDFNDSLGNSATRSNHLSGTAQDINWSQHPFIKSRKKGGSFTSAEHKLLREFNRRLGGILRFGWTFHDEMHTEIAPSATRAQVSAAARSVRKRFVPPRKLSDIRKYQEIVGVTADGLHGPGTIRAIKSFQKSLSVRRTGLWDVATTKAYKRSNAVLQLGATGSKVLSWQRKLLSIGYDLGSDGADSKFGHATDRETHKFQHDAGIEADGKVGSDTEAAMDKARSKGRTGSAFHIGARGQDVREWQQLLSSLGYDLGSAGADGIFGSGTDDLTKRFELTVQFKPNGTVTPSLIVKANETIATMNQFGDGRNSVSFFLGSAGDDVLKWQQGLISLNYNLGDDGADGKFGPSTEEATKAFQAKRSVEQDGKVGPNTLLEMKDALDSDREEVEFDNVGFLDNLADIANGAGLNVEEVEGWEKRTAAPEGGKYGGPGLENVRSITVHHTAVDPATNGNIPSMNTLLNGNGNTTGPLSQYGLGRDGTVYVIAAGICWHAGATNDPDIQSNRHAIGIEAEHSGSLFEPWTVEQYEAYVALVEALLVEWPDAKVLGHKEISTTGKVDPNFSMESFRSAVSGKTKSVVDYGNAKVPTIRAGSRGFDVAAWQRFLESEDYSIKPDGAFGPKTLDATKSWQESVGIVADGIVGSRSHGAMYSKPDPEPTQEEESDPTVRYRIGGSDRFETSAALSRAAFPQGSDRVFLIADGSPDNQSAGNLNFGSILIIKRGAEDIPLAIAEEIQRLQPREIIAIGLHDAVSDIQYDLATKAANL